MPLSPWTKTQLPDYSDVDDVPKTLSTIFNNIDSQFVLRAANALIRDSQFATLPKGSLVITLDNGYIWVKMDDNNPIWSNGIKDTGYLTSPEMIIHTGWSYDSPPKYRLWGQVAEIKAKIIRKGADIIASATGSTSGNIADLDVFHVPNLLKPSSIVPFQAKSSLGTWGMAIDPSGEVTITDGPPGAYLQTDQHLIVYANYLI